MKKLLLSIITFTTFSYGALAQDSTAFIANHDNFAIDGQEKYANISTPAGSNLRISGDWTIEAWIKITQSASEINLIETYSSGNTGGFALRLISGKFRAIQITNPSSNLAIVTGATTLNNNVWHHIAATLNESTQELKVYVNGVLDGTLSTSLSTLNLNNVLRIGSRGDVPLVRGETAIDEVRIWNIAKTEAQIQSSSSSCLGGNENNLLAWYNFEGTPTTTLMDNSSNGNDGTYINFHNANFTSGVYSCSTTGISKFNDINMNITPNPVSNNLNITTQETINQVSIYNTNGSLIKIVNNDFNTINVSELSRGMYILVVQTENGISQDKFIKE